MIVWELCFSLFYFSERGKTGFVSRHRYFLRRPRSPPDATCLRRQRVSLPLGPTSRGPWEPPSSVGTTAWWGWLAPAQGWPPKSAQGTLILFPARSPTCGVLPLALHTTAWDIIFPFFLLALMLAGAHRPCWGSALTPCHGEMPQSFSASQTFRKKLPPFKRCYLREASREWTLHSAASPRAGGGCKTPNLLCLQFATQQGAHGLEREAGWPPISGPTFPTEQCPAGQRDLFPTVA